MKHAIYRVMGFEVVGPFTLEVVFDDGVVRKIDFGPILKGELYAPLRNRQLFEQVRIDPEVHTLVWPSGADFDPATLHDWPEVAGEFAAMADRWERAGTGEVR